MNSKGNGTLWYKKKLEISSLHTFVFIFFYINSLKDAINAGVSFYDGFMCKLVILIGNEGR